MVSRKSMLALLGVGVSAFVLSAAGAFAADKKMDQHIENLSKAASAGAAGSADPAALVSERARREAAEKMVAQLQAQNREGDAKLSELQQQLAQAATGKNKPGANAGDVKKYQDQIAALNEQIGQLQAARTQSDAQMAQLQKQLASAPSAMEMQQQADIERARRLAAERAMVELQSSTRGNDQQVQQLQQQLAAANAKAQAAAATPAADPQAAVEKARRQATEATLQKAQNMASAADAENIRLAKENAAMAQQMAQLKAAAASNQMSQAASQLAALEQRNAELMAQLAAARTQSEAAAKASVMTTSNDSATNMKIAELGQKAAADRAEYQALLEAEKSRRIKLEAMLAQGGGSDDTAKVQAMAQQISELNARNAQLETRLKAEGAGATTQAAGVKSDNAALASQIGDATVKADKEQIARLEKQLNTLKSDNQMLASRLAGAKDSNAPAAAPAVAPEQIASLEKQLASLKADNQALSASLAAAKSASASVAATPTVYSGDDQIAGALAETKSMLASATAERDEYRNLLQRERMNQKGGTGTASAGDAGANERVAQLESERAELIKRLEFEKSKNEGAGIPSGGEPTGVLKELQDKLASTTAERDRLQKQLKVTQEDVIAARAQKSAPQANETSVPASDVSALVYENKRLQAELAQSGKGANADTGALQGEVASLRAQNAVLSGEISKRIAGAPDRAAMDNAAAAANFKVAQAQAAVAADVQQAQSRFNAAEAENIRLARELAATRSRLAAAAAPVAAAPAPMVQPAVTQAGQISNPPQNNGPMVVTATTYSTAPAPAPMAVTAQPVAQQQPVVMAQPAPPMMQPAAYTPAVNVGPSGNDIAGYLRRAGIPMVSGFEKVSKVSGPQFGAFRWDTGTVFGTAEQTIMTSDAGFEQAVNAYLTKTRQRCAGTFDQSFDAGQFTAHKNFAVADVACVSPDGTGAGAAMLFFYKDGTFNVVAHEGDITQFDQAMSTRDSFARFMQGII